MRDPETISLAITAAETGHLVFGTLHTNNALKAVDRIVDVFPEGQQAQIRVMLSESLRGVVAQTLLPRADRPGRVPVVEILVNVPAVANLIREGKSHQIATVMQTGRAHGMVTFDNAVHELIQKNLITKDDALTSCADEVLAVRICQVPAAREFDWRRPLPRTRNQPASGPSITTARCQALLIG